MIRFQGAGNTEISSTITLFEKRDQIQANKITLGSWDCKSLTVRSCEQSTASFREAPVFEIFEGSGTYFPTGAEESGRIARVRAESLDLAHQVIRAESSVRALAAANWFGLADHPEGNSEYGVLSVTHQCTNNLAASVAELNLIAGAVKGTYHNQFTCIPRAKQIRPSYFLPKPTAPGPQIGLVVGIDSEELATERDNRIKVQFPWQRSNRATTGQIPSPETCNTSGDEPEGIWGRVAEPSAGATGARTSCRVSGKKSVSISSPVTSISLL